MDTKARSTVFSSANPHALAIILEASETKSIIAATDIFDIRGIKLWARDRPVSAELQRKLQDRQLRDPLETCLVAEDGVTTATLLQTAQALMAEPTPLQRLLRPHAEKILREIPQLPLHPVAQLLLTAGEASRPEAFEHAVAAMALCGALMDAHGGNASELRAAMLCGLLHDLGKAALPDAVLHKPAVLDEADWRLMRQHAEAGARALQAAGRDLGVAVPVLDVAQQLARSHHERWDGQGYPEGLSGADIPLPARLMAVADVFDALLSPRAWRPAMPLAQARQTILDGRGRHFDPEVVDAFVECFEALADLARRWDGGGPDDGPA